MVLKSKLSELRTRGYIEDLSVSEYEQRTQEELLLHLNDSDAVVRSLAAKALRVHAAMDEPKVAEALLNQLYREKKLYTRLEITASLEQGGILTAKHMTRFLGKIGTNQYHELPERPSKKTSYPLPRDIIARSLGRMNVSIAPVLFDVLENGSMLQRLEVLDAIGFLFFYHKDAGSSVYAQRILDIARRYQDIALIQWKSIQCLTAFPCEESEKFLEMVITKKEHPCLVEEAKRSLQLMIKL